MLWSLVLKMPVRRKGGDGKRCSASNRAKTNIWSKQSDCRIRAACSGGWNATDEFGDFGEKRQISAISGSIRLNLFIS
jgi:hypothetical protein